MNRKKHLALSCMALAVGLTVGSANAAPIAIANANFEAPLFDEDGAGGSPDWYWVPDWDEGGGSYVLWEAKAESEGWSGAGSVLYMDVEASGWVSQNLGYNWTAGEVFTLGIKGNQGYRSGGSFKIQLRQADATVLWASGTVPVTSTVRNFSWSIDASTFTSGTPGSQLNIRIECLANTVDLDDVTLSTSLADTTAPTLASSNIVDDKSGGSVNPGQLVTYTVTFSEDMDASTVSASDFGNAGSASVTIGTVTEPSPGVFTVPVTATGAGTLQLKVNVGAVLNDAVGNALDTTPAILDDTTITIVIPPGNTGSGGTITYTDSNGLNPVALTPYIGGYVVHTFTNSGAYFNSSAVSADVLVVAGGGGGGASFGGGGGAGGLIYSNGYTVVGGSNYTVTVGAGGAGGVARIDGVGFDGKKSSLGSLVAYGGGGGGAQWTYAGRGGGSGGGSSYIFPSGGSATNSGSQGHNGGRGLNASGNYGGGGGGGAGTVGTNGTSNSQGHGGQGRYFSQFVALGGSPAGWFAGGGAGGSYLTGATQGNGGNGGGGNGGNTSGDGGGGNGVANTGGGGGSGNYSTSYIVGGAGGSGIVIVKYPYTPPPPSGTLISFF
jgi:hypothetical protein